eukprot:6432461-Alexandrium_andersonii.AAC.1
MKRPASWNDWAKQEEEVAGDPAGTEEEEVAGDAAGTEEPPAKVMKKPSSKGGVEMPEEEEDEEAEGDSGSITPQQRYVWKKSFGNLPPDVQKAYKETSGQAGGPKQRNMIINSIVPKTAGYGDLVPLKSSTFNRFRTAF